MAKDDYFVIVYQLLKYLYECLKQGARPDDSKLTATYFNIPLNYWEYIVDSLSKEGFIDTTEGIPTKEGILFSDKKEMMITPDGIQYLFDNSLLQKAKQTLNESEEMAPLE